MQLNNYVIKTTSIEIKIKQNDDVITEVEGDNDMGNLYKSMFSLINGANSDKFEFNNTKCLPKVYPINIDAHETIKKCVLLVLLLTLFQAHVKRWRSICAGCIYPERDQQRAMWLHNQLIMLDSGIGSLLKNRKNENKKNNSYIGLFKIFLKIVYHVLNFFYIVFMFSTLFCLFTVTSSTLSQLYYNNEKRVMSLYFKIRKPQINYCIKCSELQNDSIYEEFVKCTMKDCKGLYCEKCYHELSNMCQICKTPMVVNKSLEDILFEKDSSDEEEFFG